MKRVIVVASGLTERAALPFLLAHLQAQGVRLEDVRMSPNGKLSAEIARKIIVSTYWSAVQKPDKFVILIDADGRDPLTETADLQQRLEGTFNFQVPCVVTAAKWHLEAWFFGDEQGLRDYLGHALGNVDASKPDDIHNPKHCLKNLLAGDVYTARTAGNIARTLSPVRIAERSPSFRSLVAAMKNGKQRAE